MSTKWECYFCGCNNAAGQHVCLLCKLKRTQTSMVPAQLVLHRNKKKLTVASIARALLHDDRKHSATGYDMQLGIDLARAVLNEEKKQLRRKKRNEQTNSTIDDGSGLDETGD